MTNHSTGKVYRSMGRVYKALNIYIIKYNAATLRIFTHYGGLWNVTPAVGEGSLYIQSCMHLTVHSCVRACIVNILLRHWPFMMHLPKTGGDKVCQDILKHL